MPQSNANAARRRRGRRRLTVWLPETELAALEALAKAQGVTLSDAVRAIVGGAVAP